jgi:hypothetical protein
VPLAPAAFPDDVGLFLIMFLLRLRPGQHGISRKARYATRNRRIAKEAAGNGYNRCTAGKYQITSMLSERLSSFGPTQYRTKISILLGFGIVHARRNFINDQDLHGR